jgi:hypothetical protein
VLAHPTLDQLNTLGLHGMAKGFKELEHKPEAASTTPNGSACCSNTN